MKNVHLNFEAVEQNRREDLVAVAEVKANNEQKAESVLDAYLEDKYPNYGREESHFEENGIYYFNVIK